MHEIVTSFESSKPVVQHPCRLGIWMMISWGSMVVLGARAYACFFPHALPMGV
jgi:hypothetical protein